MLFRNARGWPAPILPVDRDGTDRVPDGVRIFTVYQAAAYWGDDPARLESLWLASWGDALPSPARADQAARLRLLAEGGRHAK